eukprot:COSAG05_NODE_4838_length_1354_cov_1.392032_1_plen_62_part_00
MALPVKFSQSAHAPQSAAPVLGADTASVLGELGLEEGVMRELVAVAAKAGVAVDPANKILL